MDFNAKLQSFTASIEIALDKFVPPSPLPYAGPNRIHDAMRYSLQAGGKRLRPVLLLAAHEALSQQNPTPDPLPAAVAIECLHTYSLIHDDLPCMDNDDLRRGIPTSHKKFDEATALLAGDALLTHAFDLLANNYNSTPALALQLLQTLSLAGNSTHLIGGQMQDLLSEKNTTLSSSDLDYIHLNKTAALVEASLVSGGIIAGASTAQLETLRTGGRHLGLAFQIIDDILDATSTAETLGKTPGKDAAVGKSTYVTLHGLDRARDLAGTSTDLAISSFQQLPDSSSFLLPLTQHLLSREK